jgi:DNA-binding CsgD family transcriptional regulator/tetratricopeptide (TPR) repeat protein
MVGRGNELNQLVAAVTAPPAMVSIEGEAGIGKTRLVTELAALPRLAGRRILMGRCHGIRESFPLGAMIEALHDLPDDQSGGLQLSPVAGALRPLLPELGQLLPPAPGPLSDRAAERHRVFRAVRELLDALGPVVLVLEDLHWGDEQTIDLLGYLLAEMPPDLAVVATFRGQEVSERVRAVTATLPATAGRTELVLAPLDRVQTGQLAAAILAREVPDDFAKYLRERTAGLPFAIEELLALLRSTHDGHGHPRWTRDRLERLRVPIGVRSQVTQRVSRLSGDARAVVAAAAVLQTPVRLPVLVSMSGLPGSRALRGMEEALASGVLAEHGQTIGTRHPLAAQAVYETLPLPRRQQLHSRAATAWKVLMVPPLGQIAHHLFHAGRLDEWKVAAERAADQAIALGHDGEAARLLEDMMRYAPLNPPRRGEIALKLIPVAMEALRAPAVVGLVTQVLDEELPRRLRGELRFLLVGLIEQTSNDRSRVRKLLAEAVEDLKHRPDLRAWALVGLGLPHVAQVTVTEHRRWLDRALAMLPQVGDAALEAFLYGKAAMVLTYLRDPVGATMVDRVVERTGGVPAHRYEVKVYHSVGLGACYLGRHQRAGELLEAGLQGALACESQRHDLGIRAALAVLDYCRGAWDGLAGRVERLIDDLANDTAARLDIEMVAGCLALARGELDESQQRLEVVAAQAEVQGVFEAPTVAAAALARLAVARCRPEDGVAAASRVLEALRSKQFWGPVARLLPAAVEAMAATGQHRAARALVDRCDAEFGRLDAPLAPAALWHARGLLDAATGQPARASETLLAAAGHYRSVPCPYEAAQASEQAAQCLFASGDARSGEALRAALTTYHRLGATWDAARAARTGRRNGVPLNLHRRGGRRGYGSQLSPRQREVAELAARGVGNKQIATELFISVHTVERHVTEAMRKLGVRSRAAMAQPLFGSEVPAARQPVPGA